MDCAVADLAVYSPISLRTLRMSLQTTTGANLVSEKATIKRMAEQSVATFTEGVAVEMLPAGPTREFGSLVCKLPRNRFFRTGAASVVAGFCFRPSATLKLMLDIEVYGRRMALAGRSAAIPDISHQLCSIWC